MKKHVKSDKVQLRRRVVKSKKKTKTRIRPLEREYQQIFIPNPLPHKGIYTEEDSLEQPSPLEYYPSTATPGSDAAFTFSVKNNAELE